MIKVRLYPMQNRSAHYQTVMSIQIPNLANPAIKDNVDMTFDNNEDIGT